jgi:hypothetical protein
MVQLTPGVINWPRVQAAISGLGIELRGGGGLAALAQEQVRIKREFRPVGDPSFTFPGRFLLDWTTLKWNDGRIDRTS